MSDWRQKADPDPREKEEARPLADRQEEAMQGLAQPHHQGLMDSELVGASHGTNPEQMHAQPAGEKQSVQAGDMQKVESPHHAVEQDPLWNWANAHDPSVRLYLLYEYYNSHSFTIGSETDYSSFVQVPSTGSKSENVWVVRITREALISQQPTLVLDVGGNRSSAIYNDYWGSWVSSKAEYSCLFFLKLDFKPRSYGNFPAKMESVFLRYAKVTLQQSDYLSVFPQLVAQACESRCDITDIKPLHDLMNSCLEAVQVDFWKAGCLFSILGMLGPNSEQWTS